MEETKSDNSIENKFDNSPFRIPLRNKEGTIVDYALVDEEDYERVNQYKWNKSPDGYARTTINGKQIRLHHYVFKKPDEDNVIDHIDSNRLNDTRSNLREVSKSINTHNQIKRTDINYSSKYKGVSFDKNSKKWKTECTINKKREFIGYFENEDEAAKAYDIHTFQKLGLLANNNNLVLYEDTLKIDEIIKEKNDVPNIYYIKKYKSYYALKIYKKKKYTGKNRKTVKEAQKDLEDIDNKINFMQLMEELLYVTTTPITRNSEGIAFIKVKNVEVLVDDKYWHKLNSMSWFVNKEGYIYNSKYRMHRYIMKAKNNDIIDHINNTKEDNRINNLRIANSSLNNHNRVKKQNSSSKYFGVSLNNNKWRSVIYKDNIQHNLGYFEDEIDAAKAYNKKAIELYEDKANLNVFD
jgi:hypothetical protein